jgi:hypothetical protein
MKPSAVMNWAPLTAVLLAGCAHRTYVKPGATDTQLARDRATCRSGIDPGAFSKASLGRDPLEPDLFVVIAEILNDDITHRCLVARGWRRVEATSFERDHPERTSTESIEDSLPAPEPPAR